MKDTMVGLLSYKIVQVKTQKCFTTSLLRESEQKEPCQVVDAAAVSGWRCFLEVHLDGTLT